MNKKRKFFGTDGIRGKIGESNSLLNLKFMQALGEALGTVFGNNILIARDTRISGDMLQAALSAGVCSSGSSVLDVGVISTPAAAYLNTLVMSQVGVVISASHNPYYDNGIKLFNQLGNKLSDEQELRLEEIIENILTNQQHQFQILPDKIGRIISDFSLHQKYIDYCLLIFNNSTHNSNQGNVRNFKIIVDCANGATYTLAPEVFDRLGLDVTVINNEPNGVNINHDCGSVSNKGLDNLSKLVVQNGADLGVAFDGDGDRVILVSSNGEVIDGDQVLYILACEKLREAVDPSFGVVGTQMSNLGLEQALVRKGLAFERTKVGDRYVLECLLKNNWTLGGETSGHIFSLDWTSSCDGLIIALLIIATMAKTEKNLHELVKDFYKYPQVMVNITHESFAKNVAKNNIDILSNLTIQNAIADFENQLLSNNNGRLLIRKSGTEPLIRVMVEGEELSHATMIANQLADLIKSQMSLY